ncbi:MAG: 1,4-alpha-glucan branching protein GlgB [Acidobacteriota bacterium]
MAGNITQDEIEALVRGCHGRPFLLLGPHRVRSPLQPDTLVVRALAPGVQEVQLQLESGGEKRTLPMSVLHPEGLFQARLPHPREKKFSYQLLYSRARDKQEERWDPYSFRNLLGDFDLHLLGEGTHHRSYQKLGAHIETLGGVKGVRFAVWAPNAQSVCLTGDFNEWNPYSLPMEFHEGTGLWWLFVPGVSAGSLYKYRVRFRNGDFREKIDPYGFHFEPPPRTASIVHDLNRYQWRDQEWMKARRERDAMAAPLSTYEVHLGSWRRAYDPDERCLTYRELARELVAYVKEMGFTHIELMPITEHPYSGSWGYQTTGYFAPSSRFGAPDDFRFFVDACHQASIGVLLDWVPAHFPRDEHALAFFDGTHLYEHADPRQGSHPDWGTLIFNLGRREVRNFLLSSALFWLREYHIDGLRLDAVASMLYLDYSRNPGEWVPNPYGGKENLEAIDFLKRLNELVHQEERGVITVAEESTAWPGVCRPTHLGGLGFDLKWNMGWMHDSLQYITQDPVYRKYHQDKLTFSLLYAFNENFILPLSHDEVVHGKKALLNKQLGNVWQRFANLRVFYAYMFGHPGKKLLFMGGEFGQWREWNFDTGLDWHLLEWNYHRRLLHYFRELNRLYASEPAFYAIDFDSSGFEWIDFRDQDNSVVSFLRIASQPQDSLVFVYNFTPVPRTGYRIGVPSPGCYRELLNSDSKLWGGSNLGNMGSVSSRPIPQHGHSDSICLTLPPLAALILKPEPETHQGN